MKKYIIPLALAAMAFASCNKEEIVIPDDQKEMISFSMTDEAGAPATKAGFNSTTRIVMRMRSKDNATSFRYTRTVAQANPMASGKQYSDVLFDGSNKRYWDDAHGRKSLLSVYAVAVPNGDNSITSICIFFTILHHYKLRLIQQASQSIKDHHVLIHQFLMMFERIVDISRL